MMTSKFKMMLSNGWNESCTITYKSNQYLGDQRSKPVHDQKLKPF